MSVKSSFLAVFGSSLLLAMLGAILGSVLGLLFPEAHREAFSTGVSSQFNPVPAGLSFGAKYGALGGALIGLIAVLLTGGQPSFGAVLRPFKAFVRENRRLVFGMSFLAHLFLTDFFFFWAYMARSQYSHFSPGGKEQSVIIFALARVFEFPLISLLRSLLGEATEYVLPVAWIINSVLCIYGIYTIGVFVQRKFVNYTACVGADTEKIKEEYPGRLH